MCPRQGTCETKFRTSKFGPLRRHRGNSTLFCRWLAVAVWQKIACWPSMKTAGPQTVGDNRAISPPKISKTCLIFRYNNKLQSFFPSKIVQQQASLTLPPWKHQGVAARKSIIFVIYPEKHYFCYIPWKALFLLHTLKSIIFVRQNVCLVSSSFPVQPTREVYIWK